VIPPVQGSPESPINQAVALLRQGNYGPASVLFTEFIRENPDCADGYLGRGKCTAEMKEHAQAIEDFTAAFDLDHNSADSLWSRATSLSALGKHDEALADLNEALKLRPSFAEAYCSRAAEWIRRGKLETALEDANEAIRLDLGFAEAYYQRHLAHTKLQDPICAAGDYEEAARLGCKKDKAGEPEHATAPVDPQVPGPTPEPESEPITAHVLFMDVVKSGLFTANQLQEICEKLADVVVKTREFRAARSRDEVIALPTGDGMALVFKRKLEAPLLCSIEIARSLREDPFCRLRMGIHSGVVFVHKDINGNPNVAGPGIGLAERVMSCGGDGHILVSSSAAELLRPLSAWRGKLNYLGEYRAKSDWVAVWSFQDGAIGNSAPLEVHSRQPRGFVESA
jgi:class 3 adenylate cyclase/Tfp pilus assembly protein PilF